MTPQQRMDLMEGIASHISNVAEVQERIRQRHNERCEEEERIRPNGHLIGRLRDMLNTLEQG